MIGAMDAARIEGVIFNATRGILVDPVRGIAFKRDGTAALPSKCDGYVRICARAGCGEPRRQYAHRVIWEAVNGAIPLGHEIDHRNARRSDNRLRNLEPVLPKENWNRALRTSCAVVTGERAAKAKLTAVQVCEIRRNIAGFSDAEWGRRCGVTRGVVRKARLRHNWRHIVCHRDGTASVKYAGPPKPRGTTRPHSRRKRKPAGDASA